jgi:hypothetical protein
MRIASRHELWEPRLIDVVQAWRDREYAPTWGSDCVAFVLAAIEAVSGERLAFDGARPYRSEAGQGRWLKDMGWRDLLAAADACLGDRIAPLQVMRGDVVSDGSVLGVMMAGGAVAFSHDGMIMIARTDIVAAWPVGRVQEQIYG